MRARDLVRDLVDGFREVRVDGVAVYPWSARAGLANALEISRDRAASALLRVAYHVADGAILVQRPQSDPMVPRNVAVALGADALTYAALDDVGSRHPDLYGPADAGYWPVWRDQPPTDDEGGDLELIGPALARVRVDVRTALPALLRAVADEIERPTIDGEVLESEPR